MALVGIARLASQSGLLESKAQVEYREIAARSLLNRTKPNMPFAWTINPYRGCEFACKYCYARYAHEYMELAAEQFENLIYAKAAPELLLRRELARIPRRDGIAIGTATDPYQPAERRFARTRAILEVFARERGRNLSIVTKSDLVRRDIPLLLEVARRNKLDINVTITTLDADLARALEPRAPRPDLRLGVVASLAEAGLSVGVFPNPVMPWITDSVRNLDALASAAKAAGAGHFGGGPLYLGPAARKIFFPFLETRFPELAPRYRELFARGAYLGRAYKDMLRDRIRAIRERHGLSSSPVEHRPEFWDAGEEQLSLFPLQ